jgi:hypothetical protein
MTFRREKRRKKGVPETVVALGLVSSLTPFPLEWG